MINKLELTVSALLAFAVIAGLSYVSLLTMRFIANIIYQVFFKG